MAETFASAQTYSQLTELEAAKLDAATSKVSAHNSQVAALQANIQAAQIQLQGLYDKASTLQKSFNDTIAQISQQHPDLQFNAQAGVFVPKPPEAPAAPEKASAAPATSVQ